MNVKTSKYIEIVLAIIALAITVYFYRETSLNFTYLGIIAIIMILVLIRVPDLYFKGNIRIKGYDITPNPPLRNPFIGYISSVLIVIFSICTLVTLHNYFYAEKDVYKNNEHHALRIDGVRISDPTNFLLVKNDSSAFFDDKNFHGSIKIEEVDSAAVTLSLKQFTHPIYHTIRNECVADTVLNDLDKSICFTAKDTVRFLTKNENFVDFWIIEKNIDKARLNLSNKRDSAYYCFKTAKIDTSNVHVALTQGYSFNGLMDGVTNHSLDFNGISIVRAKSFPQAKQHERLDGNNTQYLLDIRDYIFSSDTNDDKISRIIIGDKVYDLGNLESLNHTIKIPYNKNVFIGFGDVKSETFSFKRDTTLAENGLIIKYQKPIYRQLFSEKDKIDNSLYITSSLLNETRTESASGIGINVPNNIALYNIFNHSNNIHHFSPFHLAFTPGSTNENLFVLCEETNKSYGENEYMEDINSASGINWLFKIENLRNTTPFSAEKMMLLILIVCLASIIISNIQLFRFNNSLYHRYTFTYAEFTFHIALIYFISLRCFLLWRTSVFIPLDNITSYEISTIFRNLGHFKVLILSVVFLYSMLFITKVFILCHKTKNCNCVYDSIYEIFDNTIIKWCNKNYSLHNKTTSSSNKPIKKALKWCEHNLKYNFYEIISVGTYLISLVIASFLNSRFGIVAIVGSYFLVDIIIYSRGKYFTYKLNEINDEKGRMSLLSTLFWSLINMVIAIGCMFVIKDTGFVIMFATFCLFAIGFKIQDFYIKLVANGNNNYKLSIFVICYIIAAFLMLLAYKNIIIWAVESRFFIIGISIILAIAFILILQITGMNINKLYSVFIERKKNPDIHKLARPIYLTATIISIGVIVGAISLVGDYKLSEALGDHTKQRINVLIKPADEILAETETNSDELRFLQASYNNWIIEEYHQRSENVTLFGESGNGYFKIHPQSKLGALWNAQVTDIVLLRYIITEHSKILPIILIFLFLCMLYYGIRTTTYYRFTRSILIQIPLLLFVQAILVWMANTQRFIFFGQDFPFISITPKAMLLYVFLLMTLWIFIAVWEAVLYRNHNENEYPIIDRFNSIQSNLVLCLLSVILLVCFVIGEPKFNSNPDNKGRYVMKELYNKAYPYIEGIDSLFAIHQRIDTLILKRDMHYQIYEFNNLYKSEIDSLFKNRANAALDTAEYHFPLRAWTNFVNGGSRNNSYKGLIHVHYKNDRLKIALKEDFYDLMLPYHNDNEWKGSIVEYKGTNINCNDTIIETKDYKFYQLPSNWLKPGETAHIIKKIGDKDVKAFSIETNRFSTLKTNGIDNTISLDYNDNIYVNNEIIELPNGTHNYWARNVLINGNNSFVYSQGEELYWMRDFARVVKYVNETNYKTVSSNTNTLSNNVSITLNRELSHDIYNIFEKSLNNGNKLDSRSVIVADGNGHIRAMVDYKKEYNLNPNDEEKIQDINEDIYMNYSLNIDKLFEESNWFENRNLSHMRGGPGSTQKPLVWNAVASAIDFNWNDLILYKVFPGKITHKKPEEVGVYLHKYNGENMKNYHYKKSDELGGIYDIPLTYYLAHSSNYYNSMMVYIGLHNMSAFNDKNFLKPQQKNDTTQNSLFRYYSSPENLNDEEYQKNYPFMKIGEEGSIMTFNKKNDKLDYNKSILHHQFTNIFGLYDHNISHIDSSRLANELYPKYLSNELDYYMGYTTPATSSLNLAALFNEDAVNSGMRNISVGGLKYWTVTPLHMAEMYGKVVSLNKNFTLSIDPNHINEIKSWGQDNKNYKKARPTMFEGMNLFFTQTLPGPYRANGLGIIKNEGKNVGYKTVNDKTYYFYGKTGTSNDDVYKRAPNGVLRKLMKDESKDEFRRLIIIISDTNLHDEWISPEQLKDAKFYILFFTYDYKIDDLKTTSKEIIETVLNSKVFNEYMNLND